MSDSEYSDIGPRSSSFAGSGVESSVYFASSGDDKYYMGSRSGGLQSGVHSSRDTTDNTLTDTAALLGSKKDDFFTNSGPVRRFLYNVVRHPVFGGFVLFVIFLNTIMITLQSIRSVESQAGWYFALVDNIFLGIYVVELVLKLYVYSKYFWRSGWNVFDALIVVLSFLDFVKFAIADFATFNVKILRLLRIFRAIRAIRALRVLRTISFLQHLQIIVTALLRSIPALANIVMLLFLVLYVFAVMGVTLYGHISPKLFGGVVEAIVTLFQLLTLDDWFMMYDQLYRHSNTVFVYFFSFIIIETFILINLFVAVIVNNLERTQSEQKHLLAKDKASTDNKLKKNALRELQIAEAEAAEAREQIRKTQLSMYGQSEEDIMAEKIADVSSRNQLRGSIEDSLRKDTAMSEHTREVMLQYYQLLASVDCTYSDYLNTHNTLDTMVDVLEVVKKEKDTDWDDLLRGDTLYKSGSMYRSKK